MIFNQVAQVTTSGVATLFSGTIQNDTQVLLETISFAIGASPANAYCTVRITSRDRPVMEFCFGTSGSISFPSPIVLEGSYSITVNNRSGVSATIICGVHGKVIFETDSGRMTTGEKVPDYYLN